MASSRPRPIVAGYDGTDTARVMLAWAAREAAMHEPPLVVLHTFGWTWPVSIAPDHSPAEVVVRESAAELDAFVERMRAIWPDVPIATATLGGDPATTLASVARDAEAEQIVVGWTDRLPVERLLLGSPAWSASRPVVVVRAESADADIDQRGPVVLGASGSPALSGATRFGLDFARLHRLPVLAVHAGPVSGSEVDREIGRWHDVHPGMIIEREAAAGPPGRALVERSNGAALVAVDGHGHRAVRRSLLGSASHFVLRHAACSVAVVRGAVSAA